MAHGYQNYSPEQGYLLPVNPLDWLPSDSLAFQVYEIVGEFDLTFVHAAYSADGRGAPAFAPQMLLGVLLYGHYKGVHSSRAVKRLCIEDLGARFLTGGIVPDHRSIHLFKVRHQDSIKELFKFSVHLCKAAGMTPLDHVAVDGSKFPGAASKDSSVTYVRIVDEEARLTAEIDAVLAQGFEADAAEDAQWGADHDGFSLPDHLKNRQDRLAELRKGKAELESRARDRETARKEEWDKTAPKDRPHRKTPDPETAVPEPDDRYNFVDSESRMMKGRRQYVQGYNAQVSVDSAHQVIVACGITNDCTDYEQLIPMVAQTAANMGKRPAQTLADSGYYTNRAMLALEESELDALVPPDNKWQRDKTISPPLTEAEQEELNRRDRMHHRLTTEQGRADYGYRMKTVEPVFAQIKGSPGNPLFTRFLRYGIKRADVDWHFTCMAHNLRKLIRFRAKKEDENKETVHKASRRVRKSPKFKNMVIEGI